MKKLMLIMLIAAGCAPVYVPNARNSPLFTEAGEFQGSIGIGNGLDIQGAASITNHIGIMANYSYESRNSNDYYLSTNPNNDNDEYHYHRFFEGGVGYFENQGKWCYEVFAGYGKGEGANYDSYQWNSGQSAIATGKFDRYFIQPAFGMNKKMFHISFIPRLSIVDFKEFSDDVTTYKISGNPIVFFEPAVSGRVNLMQNHFFFGFQLGTSVPISSGVFYELRYVQFSTGIGFRFGGAKKEPTEVAN